MANRLSNPNIQFLDQNGTPYIGGTLSFYASGTNTPLPVYTDSALTIARGSVIILDSAGRAGNIFLQNLQYKVVLEDSTNQQIWTMDPVYSSDISTVAMFQSFNGNPNGHVAGQQGTLSQSASVVWDFTNNILYVCTTTGTALTAVWTAINASAANSTASVPAAQGYLTLSSDAINYSLSAFSTPATDATNVSTFYYTAVQGQLVPVYNGTNLAVQNMGSNQLAFTLTASQIVGNIYDVFAFMNAGVLTLGLGPTWTVVTAGSGARGTGGGTTQLQRVAGILVNANQISSMTLSGGGTVSVPANQGTYLGSIYINGGSNGQMTCTRSWGQSRGWAVWNNYNRLPIILQAGDATVSWTYAGNGTWRQANASTSNVIVPFTGLAEEEISIDMVQNVTTNGTGPPAVSQIAIGWNSTTVPSGVYLRQWGLTNFGMMLQSRLVQPPQLGINNANLIEMGCASGSSNTTFFGTSANQQATLQYRG